MEFYSQNQKSLPTFQLKTRDQIIEAIDEAMVKSCPSDMTFLLHRNVYTSIGLEMKRRRKPFKLRISQNPIKSFFLSASKNFWISPRFSLLGEPISKAVLKVEVVLKF